MEDGQRTAASEQNNSIIAASRLDNSEFQILDGLEVFGIGGTENQIVFRGSSCNDRIAGPDVVG
jgi:hypothetical protein